MDVPLLVRLLGGGAMIFGMGLVIITLTRQPRREDVARLRGMGAVLFVLGLIAVIAGVLSS